MLSKEKCTAGKMLSIPVETLWRLLAFQILLVTLNSISILEETVCGVFKKIGVEIDERDVQACSRLKEKERTIVKFVNRKDCLQIHRVKKELKSRDPTELDFSESTKIFNNESLCPYYRGIWNKCKKLRAIQKIHQFYTISGLIRVKLEETGPSRIITHMVDLKELFPDIDIGNLSILHGFPC